MQAPSTTDEETEVQRSLVTCLSYSVADTVLEPAPHALTYLISNSIAYWLKAQILNPVCLSTNLGSNSY